MRKNKGITLVALVVTIIVLLILAGVSLSLVAGSNGIMNRVVNAVTKNQQAKLEEEIQLKLAEIMVNYYENGSGQGLKNYIIDECNKLENGGILNMENSMFSAIDGDLYYTDSEGNTSMIEVDNLGKVTIEGSVLTDGTVKDEKAPSIFASSTTNSISIVIKDAISRGCTVGIYCRIH